MHPNRIGVFTSSPELFEAVRRILPPEAAETLHVARCDGEPPPGLSLALVDGKWPGGVGTLLGRLAAHAVYSVLVDDETHVGDAVPDALSEGLADDLLLLPIRPLELLGKLKHAAHLARINELASVNAGLKILIEKFEEDLRTARGIQRSLIPERFSPVPGLKVAHKYLSGLRSGGDYLDFFEFGDRTHVGLLMSDSSGYGLSSAFLSVALRLAMKLAAERVRSPATTIVRIFEELQITMKPTESLSLFYGILNRKTLDLSYAGCGGVRFLLDREAGIRDLTGSARPLSKGEPSDASDAVVALQPGDRLLLYTDGFADGFAGEGAGAAEAAVERLRGAEAIEVINDFTFRIKRGIDPEDGMPAQDCSVMVVDVEKRVMRLAK